MYTYEIPTLKQRKPEKSDITEEDKPPKNLVQDVRFDIEATGFALIKGSDMASHLGSHASISQLTQSVLNAPLDPYDSKNTRRRLYGTAIMEPWSGAINFLSPFLDENGSDFSIYFQAPAINPEAAGVERHFAPLVRGLTIDYTLMALIRFFFEAAPRRILPRNVPQLVGVHGVTTITQENFGAYSNPKFLHQDGEPVTAVVMLHRDENVEGGESFVTSTKSVRHHIDDIPPKNELARTTLMNPLDSLIIEDSRVAHGVGAIRSKDGMPAVRAVLLIDFSPLYPQRTRHY